MQVGSLELIDIGESNNTRDMQIRKLVASTAVYLFIYFFFWSVDECFSFDFCTSSTMQKVIGPIRIFHL